MSYAGVPSAATAVVDTSLNCDPAYMQLTMGAIPAVPPLAASSCLPFGLCVHPLAQHRTLPKELPLVDFGPTGVIRCKRCRTYINPFVTFSNAGRTWKCNICANLNDVPHLYHSPIDDKGRRADMMEKPELSRVGGLSLSPYLPVGGDPPPPKLSLSFSLDPIPHVLLFLLSCVRFHPPYAGRAPWSL